MLNDLFTEGIYAHSVEKSAKITPVGVHLTLVVLLCSRDWYNNIYINGEVRILPFLFPNENKSQLYLDSLGHA